MRRFLAFAACLLFAAEALAQSIELDAGAADDTARPALTVSRETQTPEKPAALPSRPLRILLAYTPKALADVPDIHAGAALVIGRINMTLANSNIPLTAELVGMDRVDYAETAAETSVTMLDAVTNGAGDFARIRILRTAVKADVVMVLAHWTYDGACGRGWQLDTLDSGAALSDAARFGYSVVSTDGGNCAFARSAPHEIGHNLGAAHDRFVVPGAAPGPSSYNYGYVDTAARVRDMMAYANECTAQGLRCVRLFIYADPDIIHNGRPLGVPVANPKAAAAARRIREIAPYVTQFRDTLRGLPNMLAVLTGGQGAVTGPHIYCGPACSAEYVDNAAVALTPTPAPGWRFAGWSGACGGLGACAVTMGGPRTVNARFIPSLHLGGVDAASRLRVANTGGGAGRVMVDITNAATGAYLGRWTSPAVAPNAAREITAADLESAIVPGTPLPAAYTVTVEPEFDGSVQHISTRGGALANLSTCDAGVTADPRRIALVQSSAAGPGTIVVAQTVRGNATVNAGNHDTAPVTLTLFDAADGARLGAYTTPSIPRGGQLMVAVADIERAAGLTPAAMRAYTIATDDTFAGALQYLVTRGGVMADLTTACAFSSPPPVFNTNAMIQAGPVFPAGAGGQSYLRFFNTGAVAGTVNVTLADATTGAALGQWTSPAIAAGATRQVPLSEIEAAVPAPRRTVYAALVQAQITGTVQHVIWRPDGVLVNASTCDAGVAADPTQVAHVHGPSIAGYARALALTNTGTAAARATLGLYDAATGLKRGVYTTAPVPPGAQITLSMALIQAELNASPTDPLHYVVKTENGFPGFLQHLVANTAAGVVTDLTAACALPAPSLRYALCDPESPCPLPVDGTPVAGQLKAQYLTDSYRVSLAAGKPVTIEVKGRDSNSGTLFAPRLAVYGADLSTPLAITNAGGAGRDLRSVFTPPAGGAYTLVVSAREAGYSNEDDFQVVTPTTGTYRISVNQGS